MNHLRFRGRGVLDVGDVEVGTLLVPLQPRHVDPEAAGDDALAAPPRLPLAALGWGRGHRLVGARPHPHRAVALLTLLEPPEIKCTYSRSMTNGLQTGNKGNRRVA